MLRPRPAQARPWLSWAPTGTVPADESRLGMVRQSRRTARTTDAPAVAALPVGSRLRCLRPPRLRRQERLVNDLAKYREVFKGIRPFEGTVPAGYEVDFLGALSNLQYESLLPFARPQQGPRGVRTSPPEFDGSNGEPWFEAVNWVETAREAVGMYVMFSLGACWGAQAVGCYRALQRLNPMPCKLVVVEPEPGNLKYLQEHLHDNGIDPDDHWIVPLALGDSTAPAFFPIGSSGIGGHNCLSTNERIGREIHFKRIVEMAKGREDGAAVLEEALRTLILDNRTGLTHEIIPGEPFVGEIELVSSLTLRELLGPFRFVDYIEADLQQSEILVFPSCLDLLRRKVRRIHIGTHGADVHQELLQLFANAGWEILFSYPPNSRYKTVLGSFETNDGILTVLNPDLSPSRRARWRTEDRRAMLVGRTLERTWAATPEHVRQRLRQWLPEDIYQKVRSLSPLHK